MNVYEWKICSKMIVRPVAGVPVVESVVEYVVEYEYIVDAGVVKD